MTRRGAIALALALAACAPGAEEPAPRGEAELDADPCYGRMDNPLTGVRIMVSYAPGDCGALGPAEVIDGIWYRGFEEMDFVENATRAPGRRVFRQRDLHQARHIELWITRAEQAKVIDDDPRIGTRAILIRFVGRRGRPVREHGTTFQHMAVDRLLNARVIAVIEDFIDCREFAPGEFGMPCAPGTEAR